MTEDISDRHELLRNAAQSAILRPRQYFIYAKGRWINNIWYPPEDDYLECCKAVPILASDLLVLQKHVLTYKHIACKFGITIEELDKAVYQYNLVERVKEKFAPAPETKLRKIAKAYLDLTNNQQAK